MRIKAEYLKCKSIILILLLALLAPVYAPAQNDENDKIIYENGNKYYIHIVQKGETIYGIAEKFHLKTSDIVFENPSAIDGIKAGDELKIPASPALVSNDSIPQARHDYLYHKVEPKETLYALAKKYHTTQSIIDSLNPAIVANGLHRGMTIRIPVTNVKTTDKNKETQAYKNLINNNNKLNNDTAQMANGQKTKVLLNKMPALDSGKKLDRYNIALIMPFSPDNSDSIHLNTLVAGTTQIPFATQFSTDFFYGFKLALDSLSHKGFKANLHVFNLPSSSDSASMAIDSILKNPALAKMNLVIGPPYPSDLKKTVLFAAKNHIPVVSPLSGDNSVLKANPYTSKATPSTVTEMEQEAVFIAGSYRHANIIIVHNRSNGDETYYNNFKRKLKESMVADSNSDSVYMAEYSGGLTGVGDKLSEKSLNIVVVPYTSAALVARFINQFANSSYAKNDSIILFGMQSWTNNDALDVTNLDTLQFHFPSNAFVDYNDTAVKLFILKYRNNFFIDPGYYSFEGFDIGMFYGLMLKQYGTGLQNHLADLKYKGIQTSFNMERSKPGDGYENRGVYILQYKDYIEIIVHSKSGIIHSTGE